MKIILASASPRRRKLLKDMGFRFKVIPPNVEEKTHYKRPHLIVCDLSRKKAISVATKHPNAAVIGVDTIVYCKGRIIGKPKNVFEAKRLLKIQSGRWQSVYTAITLAYLKKNIILTDYEKSICYMRKLSEKEISKIAPKHIDKAGGWAVQDKDDLLIKKIKGDFTNVVGFPVKIFKKLIKKLSKL
ncbi:MAG: Maf family protein [Elusimicrobiales bacterium]